MQQQRKTKHGAVHIFTSTVFAEGLTWDIMYADREINV